MAEIREWTVSLLVNTEHIYTVTARTPEEAEDEAEDRLRSGDTGIMDEEPEIVSLEAISSDTYAEPEELEEEDLTPLE